MTARLACGQLTARLSVKELKARHSLMPLNDFALVQLAAHSVILAVVREAFSCCLSSLDSEPEDLSFSFSAHESPLSCISTSATAQIKLLELSRLYALHSTLLFQLTSVSCLAGHLPLQMNLEKNGPAFCLCPFGVTSTILQSQGLQC